jgi:hypothetical protein
MSTITPSEVSTATLFENRKVYKEQDTALEPDTQPLVDIIESRQMYGKINANRRSIYLSEANLTPVSSQQSTETIFLINFVAKAFSDFRGHMLRAALSKKINAESSVMFNLQPARGWSPALSTYHGVMDKLYLSFYNDYIRVNNINENITDFDSFAKAFMDYATTRAFRHGLPFTLSGFIGSKYCAPHCSGLIIDLHTLDHNNDRAKNELFLQDVYFEFYKNTAKKFGFVIDKNAPWRLIADLSSIAMKKYMYGEGQTYNTIFNNYYYRAIERDLQLFKEYTIGFYNSLVATNPLVRKTRFCSTKFVTLQTTVERVPVAGDVLDSEIVLGAAQNKNLKYPVTYWLDKYILLRMAETKSKLEPSDVELMKINILRMQRVVDLKKVMMYIDDTIQKNSGINVNVFKQDDWKDFVYTPPPPPQFGLIAEIAASATQAPEFNEVPVETDTPENAAAPIVGKLSDATSVVDAADNVIVMDLY